MMRKKRSGFRGETCSLIVLRMKNTISSQYIVPRSNAPIHYKYLDGEVSTWKAAEIAGISLRKMNKIMQEKGVEMHYSEKSLKEDLELECIET